MLSFLFMSFESSLFLSLPFNLFVFCIFFFFFWSVLKNNYFLIKMIMYHFFDKFFPSVWNLIYIFYSILLFNILSLFPSSFSMSSLPLMTLSVSLILWMSSYLICLKENYKSCVGHFLPQGSPMVLSIMLVWIEILSWLCRPMALGIRLMANITASHLLMFLCSSSVFFMNFLFFFLLLLISLEVGVSFIQAYVYKLLLSLYMKESLEF